MRVCSSCGRQVAQRAKFCAHCGASQLEASASTETIGTAPEAPAVLTTSALPPDDSDDRTVVERILGGDWRSAAYVAVPTVLVAYAAGLVASLYLVWIDDSGDSSFGLGHSAAGYFHSAGVFMAMALGSPVFTSGNDSDGGGGYAAGSAPLTITLVVVAVFALLLRSYLRTAAPIVRFAAVVRTGLLTALGLAAVSFAAYDTQHVEDTTLHLTVSPGRVFGWSLLALLLVGTLLAFAGSAAQRFDGTTWSRVRDEWRLPLAGGAVAVTTAVLLGGVAAVIAFFVEADGDRLDVAKVLPLLAAYLVNLGINTFHVSLGAALHAGFNAPAGGDATVSLFDRHGLSAGYFALLALPPAAIAAGIGWMRRVQRVDDPQLLARSCYRMALPAAILYAVLAVPSGAGYSFGSSGFGGSGHAGPQVFYGALVLAAWFVVLGFVAGRYLLRRSARTDPGSTSPRAPAWLRRPMRATSVALAAAIVGVATGAAGVASASDTDHSGDLGLFSELFVFGAYASSTSDASEGFSEDSGGSTVISPPPTVVPVPQTTPMPSFQSPDGAARIALQDLAVAEESYYLLTGRYTADVSALSPAPTADVPITVVRADENSFCAEAASSNGTTFSYDSARPGVVPGAAC